ncbi:MAG: hypothetical protein VW405_08940 [Rhodospirillaceae bacterium]
MLSQQAHVTYLSPELLDAAHFRAHRLRSRAFTGFMRKAVDHDYDVMKDIDTAR